MHQHSIKMYIDIQQHPSCTQISINFLVKIKNYCTTFLSTNDSSLAYILINQLTHHHSVHLKFHKQNKHEYRY